MPRARRDTGGVDGELLAGPGGDALVAFAAARLDEDEGAADAAGGERWEVGGDADDADVPADRGGNSWIAVGPWDGGMDCAEAAHIARHDPARVLREVEAKRAIIGSQTSDHAPVETMYGLCCRTCVDWQDAPVAEGGETEFGIAIPQQWPCRVARSAVASWSDHPEYRKDEWAL